MPEITRPCALAVLCVVAACGKGKQAKSESAVVAEVGNHVISADDFKAKLGEQQPFIQARYTTLERKKEFLDGLIRFELLTAEAERRGLEHDPEVQATLKKVMVQKLLHDQQEATVKPVPDDELKKYYADHEAEFVRPERVRLSHVFLAAPKDGPKRGQVQKEAEKLLLEVKGKEAGPVKTAFAESAQKRSDDAASKTLGGDLNFRTREELSQSWGPALADAANGLRNVGDIAGPVATDKGFHLIKLTGRQPGMNQSFEQVRPRLEARLQSERRTKSVDAFVAELKAKTPVKINDDALAKIEVGNGAPRPPPTNVPPITSAPAH